MNPGVADLLQTLSSGATGSLSSLLSSTSVQSALQIAAPEDVVQLSQEAQQLVEANGLFAAPGVSQAATDPATLLIQAINSSLSGSTSPQAATTSQTSQQQLVADLFPATSTSL
jgi:hypothetical protein